MSLQSARDFLAKLGKDEEFRKGLSGCKTRADQRLFAQEAGFEFTGDEVKAAGIGLQDADLDMVSGGNCCSFTCEPEVCAPE
jgi:predicted ribosomally synthesized peptide with nif11-like leader